MDEPSAERGRRRLPRRYIIAAVAIATELIAGIVWWRRRGQTR